VPPHAHCIKPRTAEATPVPRALQAAVNAIRSFPPCLHRVAIRRKEIPFQDSQTFPLPSDLQFRTAMLKPLREIVTVPKVACSQHEKLNKKMLRTDNEPARGKKPQLSIDSAPTTSFAGPICWFVQSHVCHQQSCALHVLGEPFPK
jgi:hypothetical protein